MHREVVLMKIPGPRGSRVRKGNRVDCIFSESVEDPETARLRGLDREKHHNVRDDPPATKMNIISKYVHVPRTTFQSIRRSRLVNGYTHGSYCCNATQQHDEDRAPIIHARNHTLTPHPAQGSTWSHYHTHMDQC